MSLKLPRSNMTVLMCTVLCYVLCGDCVCCFLCCVLCVDCVCCVLCVVLCSVFSPVVTGDVGAVVELTTVSIFVSLFVDR